MRILPIVLCSAMSAAVAAEAPIAPEEAPVRMKVKRVLLNDFVLESILSANDAEKMALHYYSAHGRKNMFSVSEQYLETDIMKIDRIRKSKAKICLFDCGDSYASTSLSPHQSGGPFFKGEAQASKRTSSGVKAWQGENTAFSYEGPPRSKVKYAIGADAPFGTNWGANYGAYIYAAANVGGKVLKSWPENTEPRPGYFYRMGVIKNQYNGLSTDRPVLKASLWPGETRKEMTTTEKRQVEQLDREEARAKEGRDEYASFSLDGVRSVLSYVLYGGDFDPRNGRSMTKEDINAFLFMKNVVFAMLTSQLSTMKMAGNGTRSDLFAVATSGLGFGTTFNAGDVLSYKLTDIGLAGKLFKAQWADSWNGPIGEDYLASLEQFEELVTNWYFVPLSKRGEPVKFAFRPRENPRSGQENLRWSVVEFTKNGISARTIDPSHENKEAFLREWVTNGSPGVYFPKCMQSLVNTCPRDWAGGHFGEGVNFGVQTTLKFIESPAAAIEVIDVLKQLADFSAKSNEGYGL